ncbi:MAG: hypothetical protein KGQ59_08730 [Bdellovibrionales bacterium]|nr:hypothetical protein [Bdellovibrionales bacterium]
MRTLLLMMSLFSSAWAQASTSIEELTYASTECEPQLTEPSHLQAELGAIREIFESVGLEGANPQFGSGNDFHGVDEIFTTSELGPMALLKLCLKPASSQFSQKTVEFEDGFLFHGTTPTKVPYAIFFSGIAKSDVERITTSLGSLKKTASHRLLEMIIPSAHAGKDQLISNSRPKNQAHSGKGSNRDILAATASCGIGLGKGVLAATVVPVVGVVKTAVRFVEGVAFAIRKPAEAWGRIVKRVKELSGVIKNFSISKTLRGIKGSFKDMPFGKKVEVVCAVVSALGTTAALSLLVAPMVPANVVTLVRILSTAGMIDTVKDYLIPPEKNLPDQPVSNTIDKWINSLQNIGKSGTPAERECNP